MLPNLHAHAIRCLRLLALATLVLGMLAKPVMVAACELDDLDMAQVAAEAVTGVASDPAGDECCPGQTCGECCTVATGLPVLAPNDRAMPLGVCPQATAWIEPEPVPLPVANRPPIHG